MVESAWTVSKLSIQKLEATLLISVIPPMCGHIMVKHYPQALSVL